jgi:transposase
MTEQLSIDALRAAIRSREGSQTSPEDARFEALARRYERAVQQLVRDIKQVVDQIPELSSALEDEVEAFTSPAFPDKSLEIHDQRLRVTYGDDVLLFDPTAKALLSALGQIEIEASRPLPFMIEKVLYLIPGRDGGTGRWGYRSIENLGGPLAPFNQNVLLRMLHAVFCSG